MSRVPFSSFWSLSLEPIDESAAREAVNKLLQGEPVQNVRLEINEANVRVFNGCTIVPQRKELGEE